MRNVRAVIYHTDENGFRVALAEPSARGTFVRVITLGGSSIDVRKVPVAEQRYMSERDTLSAKKVAKSFRAYGRNVGITKRARQFLRGI